MRMGDRRAQLVTATVEPFSEEPDSQSMSADAIAQSDEEDGD